MRMRSEMEGANPHRFALSPVLVIGENLDPDTIVISSIASLGQRRQQTWKAIPLPIAGKSVADFAYMDETCWMWLSADELMATGACDTGYSVAACLYYALIGDLFPQDLSRTERFRRMLVYRTGNLNQLQQTLTATIPAAHTMQPGRLTAYIGTLLAPSLGRPMTTARAANELEEIARELRWDLLATAWEAHGQLRRSHRFIKRMLAHMAPSDNIAWEDVARIAIKVGDEPLAQVARSFYRPHDYDPNNQIILKARATVLHGLPPYPELTALLDQFRDPRNTGQLVNSSGNPEIQAGLSRETNPQQIVISGETFLYLTYANGRWLEHLDEALNWLTRPQAVTWDRVITFMLRARLYAEKGEWRQAAAACAQGIAETESLPNRGSEIGTYARAYLYLLDGIAHLCGVYRHNFHTDYLNRGLERFQRAWNDLSTFQDTALMIPLYGWFAWFAKVVGEIPDKSVLQMGALSFLQLVAGPNMPTNVDTQPPVPWFEEERVFGSLQVRE